MFNREGSLGSLGLTLGAAIATFHTLGIGLVHFYHAGHLPARGAFEAAEPDWQKCSSLALNTCCSVGGSTLEEGRLIHSASVTTVLGVIERREGQVRADSHSCFWIGTEMTGGGDDSGEDKHRSNEGSTCTVQVA